MKILWVCPLFLHPTTKGGQIRTLETLRQLHRRHEVHFVGLDLGRTTEGVDRAREYCSHVYPVKYRPPSFLGQFVLGAVSSVPLAVIRFRSEAARELIQGLQKRIRFDHVVCDFLAAAPNIPDLSESVLFQHNVETMIWERREKTATNPFYRALFRNQRKRMFNYERDVCRQARHVIAVSEEDANRMRSMFGVDHVSDVPTGVDIEYFAPPAGVTPVKHDLVFVGSMDWAPNIDGMLYFIKEVLPLIRRELPQCKLAIVGRTPHRSVVEAAAPDPLIEVTGTVPDIRPYFWESAVSIVPLRIGGGTRLKIFEAMAAKEPVVSTTIGAEGLPVQPGRHFHLADNPAEFAARCVELLRHPEARRRMADEAWRLVKESFSWEHATSRFEDALAASTARRRA